MALTSITAKVNLTTSKLELQFVNAAPAITAGSVRILAPDDQYYYGFGTSVNFAASTGTLVVNASAISAWLVAIDLPLDINGAVQLGTYKVDCNYTAGGALSYSGVLSTAGFPYMLCDIPEPKPGVTVDCINAQAVFADQTGFGYILNSATPTISRTMTVQKMNGLPSGSTPPLSGWVGWTYTGLSTTIGDTGATLGYPNLYSGVGTGGYKVTVSVVLTYDYGTWQLTTSMSKNEVFDVTCDKTLCDLFCGINTLKMNMEDSIDNTKKYNELRNKWLDINLYRNLMLEAYRCNNATVKASAFNKIKEIGGFTENCCGSNDADFQISAYQLCDCADLLVEVPQFNTSIAAFSGYVYKIGDATRDANYNYYYLGIGVWGRDAIQQTTFTNF